MPYEKFMKIALEEARIARDSGEVPVGAVIVEPDGSVVARAHNQREALSDPTAHAEIQALRLAGLSRGKWRMEDLTLYVTLEPCPMCAGAVVQSRLSKLVYGCDDPKAGACGTLMNITADSRLNHQVDTVAGVLEDECRQLMTEFFNQRR